MADSLQKVWALFMSDPVSFITAMGTLTVFMTGAVVLAWRFRGFIEKKHRETVDVRLQLASDKEKTMATELETAKRYIQNLEEKISYITIDPQAIDIKHLASGTASSIDRAMIANNELRSTLDELRSHFLTELQGWIWDRPQTSWQDRIPGCFGDKDGWFAGHPLDERRAKEAIKEAKDAGASRDDFEKEIEKYLNEHATAKDGVREALLRNATKILHNLWGTSGQP